MSEDGQDQRRPTTCNCEATRQGVCHSSLKARQKEKKEEKRSCVISACQLDSSSPNHIYAVIGHAWHFQGWPISDADCNEIRCMESPPLSLRYFSFSWPLKKERRREPVPELEENQTMLCWATRLLFSHLSTKWGPRGRFHHQNQKTLLPIRQSEYTQIRQWVKVCSTYF